jgi:hypothetical protein
MNLQHAIFDFGLGPVPRRITHKVESVLDILNFWLVMASGKVLARRAWVDRPRLFGVDDEAILLHRAGCTNE